MDKAWTEYKKTELLKLPDREWGKRDKLYDSLLIVPTRLKHDSGYSCIAVIGCIDDTPTEILAYPDDLEMPKIGTNNYMGLRMDCSYPSGILRLWSYRYQFSIPMPTSSTEIVAVQRERTDRT